MLAYVSFPAQRRRKLRSTNPIERVVGIFPAENSIIRMVGAVLLEANDEWAVQNRCMQVEAMAGLNPPLIGGETTPADVTQAVSQAA